eukprot:jgi/Mesvir1/25251/Mv20318-RA.1
MNSESQNKQLLIIDGYGFVFRAYHVQPPLISPDGQPVGAIYGFTSMLLKIINDFRPEYAVVVLDSKGKNFRHDLFKEYKAHRPPAPEELLSQLPIVQSAAEALNFCVLSKEGFEADDIIATLAKNCTDDNVEAVIVSSDKDLLQLMDNGIKIYDPVKSKFVLQEDVLAKFGVLPNKVREVQALVGDASDNIPGVKGIGPKTASELINNFGDLAGSKEKSIHEIINYYAEKNIDKSLPDISLSQYFLECYSEMQKQLFRQKTLHLYKTIDLPLCRILHNMEAYGIKIDITCLQKLSTEFQKEIEMLEKEIFSYCGQEFNIASPKQLGGILFDKLQLPFSKISGKSKTYGTGVEILEKLSDEGYEIADLILKYRHLTKLKNTYTDALPKQVDPITSRLHTTFLQTSTTTGRLSSNNPNVQNIPIRTPEGYKLISADYSQIELRILSHVANIQALKEAFTKGEDIHKQTAKRAAINAPMQSLTADIAKMAMIAIDRKLQANLLKTTMTLQIHDELVFEAPLSEVESVTKLIKSTMENIIVLDVPIKVDISHGDNWQEI